MATIGKNIRQLSPKLLTIERDIEIRRNASVWESLAAKYREIRYGSSRPRPPPKPDVILEEMFRVSPNIIPYEKRDEAKEEYMRRKSHDMHIEKNKVLRKLTTKVTGGRFGFTDFENSW